MPHNDLANAVPVRRRCPDWPNFANGEELFRPRPLDHRLPQREVAMRVRTYRDEAQSVHMDLIGGGVQPWSVDLVSLSAAALLVSGFFCALAVQIIR